MTITNRSHFKLNGNPKVGYNSMREASAQARVLEKKEGALMAYYQCGECHLWHVGHASYVAAQSNDDRLEGEQQNIGYKVVAPLPATIPIPAHVIPAPPNPFLIAGEKLQRLSRQIALGESAIRRLNDEAQKMTTEVSSMKEQAQAILQELHQVF